MAFRRTDSTLPFAEHIIGVAQRFLSMGLITLNNIVWFPSNYLMSMNLFIPLIHIIDGYVQRHLSAIVPSSTLRAMRSGCALCAFTIEFYLS